MKVEKVEVCVRIGVCAKGCIWGKCLYTPAPKVPAK